MCHIYPLLRNLVEGYEVHVISTVDGGWDAKNRMSNRYLPQSNLQHQSHLNNMTPLRSFELSSMSSTSKEELWREPMISYSIQIIQSNFQIKSTSTILHPNTLITSMVSSSISIHCWKASINFPLTFFPGTAFMYENGSKHL